MIIEPAWHVRSSDGVEIAVYEFGGSGETLLISHATGLCGAMYRQLAAELTNTFRVVAFDFRGHGNSTRPVDLDFTWPRMADDVHAVVQRIDAESIHAVGHSMGGAALLLTEQAAPGTFRSLYLYEPIVYPQDVSTDGQNFMADIARARRFEFDSRSEALYRYASRPPFGDVRAGALVDYVDNGLAEIDSGRVRLKCLPEDEARTFEASKHSHLQSMADVTTPSMIAVGHDEEGPNPARFGPLVAATLANGRLVSYPALGHFGPFQDPWTIAADVRRHTLSRAGSDQE